MNPIRTASAAHRAFVLLALAAAPTLAQEPAAPISTPVVAPQIVPAQTQVLARALHRDDWSGVRAAVLAGADINTVGKGGVTLLMRAASARQTELVALLLERGANPNALDDKGRSALHHAIPEGANAKKKKFGKILKTAGGLAGGMLTGGLLGSGAVSGLLGGSPLASLLGGNLTALLSGNTFDLGDKSGWTAIAGAALQGDASGKVASILSRNSALDASDWTTLLSSVRESKPEALGAVSRVAGENSAQWTQFVQVASSGDAETVAQIMQQPQMAAVIAKAQSGLSQAASALPGNASRAVTSLLIEKGAKISTDRDGKTPGQLAQERGHATLTSLLSEHAPDASTSAGASEAASTSDVDSE